MFSNGRRTVCRFIVTVCCLPCLIFNKDGWGNFLRLCCSNISSLKQHECTTDHADSLVSLNILSKSGIKTNLGFA